MWILCDMTATERSHLHPRRHPWIWFWVLTAPLVFQLTYADAESRGGLSSSEAVWLTYLKGQITYAVIVVSCTSWCAPIAGGWLVSGWSRATADRSGRRDAEASHHALAGVLAQQRRVAAHHQQVAGP